MPVYSCQQLVLSLPAFSLPEAQMRKFFLLSGDLSEAVMVSLASQ